MKTKTVIALSAVTIVAISMLVPAYAGHFGIHGVTKTSGGSTLGDVKVTAEKINFYDWQRSSGAGSYSFSYDFGPTYLMAAMKNGYAYTSDWSVSPPETKDWFLSSRSYVDLKYKIVTDQDFRSDHANHETDAKTLTIDAAEPWFKEEHGIELVKHSYDGTYSRTSTNCGDIHDGLISTYSSSGAEGVLLIIGKNVNLKNDDGVSILGCASKPSSSGNFVAVVVKEWTTDPARLAMHEISHNYGLDHVVDGGFGNPSQHFKSVMHSFVSDPMSIKNWSPTEDSTLENRRGWY